jgi:hypothetical protein
MNDPSKTKYLGTQKYPKIYIIKKAIGGFLKLFTRINKAI